MRKGPRNVRVRSGQFEFVKINAKEFDWRDAYHLILTLSWPWFAGFVFGVYLLVKLGFAGLYTLDPHGVYAGAAAFVLVTRCWHRPRGAPFVVFCNYPVARIEYAGNSRSGSMELQLTGSSVLRCLIQLFPAPRVKAAFQISYHGGHGRWHARGPDGWSANVP